VPCTVLLSPVVKYHGLAHHHLPPLDLLMRPLLNGGTLARRMTGGETSHAANFFAAYFHQDCFVDDLDWASVVLRFRQSEPFDVVSATRAELEELVRSSTEQDLETFLFGSSTRCFFDPRALGFSLTAWFGQIVHILTGGSPPTGRDATVTSARLEAAAIARRALDETLDPVLACRQLSALRWRVGVHQRDPDFLTFVAMDSETDSLPVETDRHQWLPEALARMQPEIEATHQWIRKNARTAFGNVVSRFGNAG
jgi:hypothetical protein